MSKNSQATAPNLTRLPALAVDHHWASLAAPIREWSHTRRIPPVLLISGQDGIGKRSMAHSLAQWILCERRESHSSMSSCQECSSCQTLVNLQNTSFTEITSDSTDEGESNSLKIGQFRKLKETAGFGAAENRYKVIAIPDADRMTVQAANSVLKILEETPKGWIFLLTANDPTLLLPTLISRCQVLRLKPFPSSLIEKILALSGIEQERLKISARVSQGSWTRALQWSDDTLWSQRGLFFDFLKDSKNAIAPLLDWTSKQPSHLDILVDILEQFTHDFLLWSAENSPISPEDFCWTHLDGTQAFSAHVRHIVQKKGTLSNARAFWLARAEYLSEIRNRSSAPLNRKLLVQDLLFPWVEI